MCLEVIMKLGGAVILVFALIPISFTLIFAQSGTRLADSTTPQQFDLRVLSDVGGDAVQQWITQAERGDASVQLRLGLLFASGEDYLTGVRVSRDPVEAVKWYRLAAEQNNVDAQFRLGAAFHDGEGVARNYTEAAKWLRMAAEKNKPNAQTMLGNVYTLSDSSWMPNHDEAAKWYRLAADQGVTEAQVGLGNLYYQGQGVMQSFTDALAWYRKASRSPAARYNIATMYSKGEGVARNLSEAAVWFRRAADDGVPQAQFNLGRQYYDGAGVKQDYKEAGKWFQKAADQAHSGAQYLLGILYFEGKGLRQDPVRAHMWSDLAAAAATGDELPERIQLRDTIASRLTQTQIAESQRLKQQWKPLSAR
jgi:TPR repeat protein